MKIITIFFILSFQNLVAQNLILKNGFDSLAYVTDYAEHIVISGNQKLVDCMPIMSIDLFHFDTRLKPYTKGRPKPFAGRGMIGMVNYAPKEALYRELIYLPFPEALSTSQAYRLSLAVHQEINQAKYWYPEIQYKLVSASPNLDYAYHGKPTGIIPLEKHKKVAAVGWQFCTTEFIADDSYTGILIGVLAVDEKKVSKGFAGKKGTAASYLFLDEVSIEALPGKDRVYSN